MDFSLSRGRCARNLNSYAYIVSLPIYLQHSIKGGSAEKALIPVIQRNIFGQQYGLNAIL